MLLALSARAAVPELTALHPAAVARGTARTVVSVGKADPWPPGVWTDHPGVTLRPATNANRLEVAVEPDAPPGIAIVRLHNPEGASAPALLRITEGPETDEAEPNDAPGEAQPLTLPAVVNGRLEKGGDVDAFEFDLRAGRTVVASLEAFTLMSPVDAVLRLVDASGVQQAWNHDDGRTLDPFLHWTAPADGRYRLQVFGFPHPANSEIRFTGNERCVYRLRVTDGPWAADVRPRGGRPGTDQRLEVSGWNGAPPRTVVSPLPAAGPDAETFTVSLAGWENPVELRVGSGPDRLERDLAGDSPLPVPGAVTGSLDADGEVDRFAFDAAKDQRLVLRVDAARLGSPLDAWLAVDGADGRELVRKDDDDGPDPRLEWTAPVDGRYSVRIGSLRRRAVAGQVYRISVEPVVPRARARLAESAFTLRPGSTNEWKVTVSREGGHAGALRLTVDGLPPGVSAGPVEVPAAGGDVSLQVVTETNAPAFSGPVAVRLGTGPDDPGVPIPYFLTTTGMNNGVPQGFWHLVRDRLDRPWLTVLPPPPPPPDGEKPKE